MLLISGWAILRNTGQVQSLVTARSICDEDTDTTSDDSEKEIIEEFGSSDDTSDGATTSYNPS